MTIMIEGTYMQVAEPALLRNDRFKDENPLNLNEP